MALTVFTATPFSLMGKATKLEYFMMMLGTVGVTFEKDTLVEYFQENCRAQIVEPMRQPLSS